MFKFLKAGIISTVAVVSFYSAAANAEQFKKDQIVVDAPWARATHSGSNQSAAYVHIINNSNKPEFFVSVKTPVTKKAQLHEMKMENNVMIMRHIKHALKIPPHSDITFKPGGNHIMLMNLKKPLVKGEEFPMTFYFRNAGSIEAKVKIEDAAATKNS